MKYTIGEHYLYSLIVCGVIYGSISFLAWNLEWWVIRLWLVTSLWMGTIVGLSYENNKQSRKIKRKGNGK